MLVNITEYIIRDPMSQLGQAIEYEYILGDFKTDPWNASELPGIKSAYQLRVSQVR